MLLPEAHARDAFQNMYGGVDQLVEKWADYLVPVQEVAQEEGRVVDDITLMSTAICLENTEHHLNRMDEATLAVNVGSFIHHGFDLITAVMPSLIANEIVSVQPQSRRVGEIFYLEFLYGSDKGNISKGDTMFGWKTAGNADIWYSADFVNQEPLGVGAGTTSVSGTLAKIPAIAGTVAIADALGQETFSDDGAGLLTGSAGGTGTVNYATGAVALTYNASLAAATVVTASYRTDFEQNPENIPEVNLQINSLITEALPRKLRCRYSLDAAFDISSAFGRSVGSDLDVALASEIRSEIDGELLNAILVGATAGTKTWSSIAPAGVSYSEHKWTFLDDLIKVTNYIFQKTRRAVGNFIVAGVGVCNVIESLAPRFKREGKVLPGPHYIGTLDGMRVYKNPFFPDDTSIVGYKGDMFMESGLVYAPYMPVFTTKAIMLDDFISRKGLATLYSKKMVNSDFYAILKVA